ncbi:glycosyltransferase family 2 protein [Faecalibacter rhinopitheci]|uniref:Glycosyltransferase family 2 protein n=1 Tax=Faecalibacter rhinopitheci TaxID=2779678 RepID=A0A8J7FPN3_9FLAO|nr:glycosyltransferase family 2 protein [Faecalibacter rhinopitheci]MBF0597465.1 glycosyltransferase family 2 protein [Faecalibacter rhinopitheci]
MKEFKITIVTPSYNRAHTLPRVYESLKNQTFKDFKWLIMDDGSTDNTSEIVKSFQEENRIEIDYFWNENQHKFITVFEGIRKVTSSYFMIVDSDDSYPENSLAILFDEVENIPNQDDFISVMGLSQFEDGSIVGHQYPNNGFDGSIFDMRYKYKVRGDKFGIFITKTYQRLLSKFDYSIYINKGYIPQAVFFNTYDSKGIKTRFVNKVVRNYHLDDNDENSVSNTRWTGKNTFGLMEGYKSFLNSYGNRLYKYPKTLVRNIVGYQMYSIINNTGIIMIIKELEHFKILSTFLYPLTRLYKKLNKV